MVFPAKKLPEQLLDSSYRWPKPAVDGEHMTFVWADYYTKLTKAFEQAVKDTAGPFFTTAVSDLLTGVSQESMVHMFCDHKVR
jgi:superoxide dismutase